VEDIDWSRSAAPEYAIDLIVEIIHELWKYSGRDFSMP